MEIPSKINPCSALYNSSVPLNKVACGHNFSEGDPTEEAAIRNMIHRLLLYYVKNDDLYNYFEALERHKHNYLIDNVTCSWCRGGRYAMMKKCKKILIKIGFLTIRPKSIGGVSSNWVEDFTKFKELILKLVDENKHIITAVTAFEFGEESTDFEDYPRGVHAHCVFEFSIKNEKTIENIFKKRNNSIMKEIAKRWDIRGGVSFNSYSNRFYMKDKIGYLSGHTIDPLKNRKKKVDIIIRELYDTRNLYTKNVTLVSFK